jgi:cell division protein FtsN
MSTKENTDPKTSLPKGVINTLIVLSALLGIIVTYLLIFENHGGKYPDNYNPIEADGTIKEDYKTIKDSTLTNKTYTLIAGTFLYRENAEKLSGTINSYGMNSTIIVIHIGNYDYYRIIIASSANKEELTEKETELKEKYQVKVMIIEE